MSQMSRSLRALALSALFAAAASPAVAQSSLGSERRDINNLRGDVWSTWTAPAHIDGRDAMPLAAAATAIVAIGLRDSVIHAWMLTHPNALILRLAKPWRDSATISFAGPGSGQFLLPLSGIAYAAGRLSHSPSLRDGGLGCAAAHLSSAGLREIMYFSVARTRPHSTPSPDQISIPGGRDWSKHSFFSGHIANSMACMSFLAHRYSTGLATPVMYGYASAIGLARMADGWHWASDTMTGAIVGYAIGKLVADRQRTRAAAATSVAPAAAAHTLRVTWSFSF